MPQEKLNNETPNPEANNETLERPKPIIKQKLKSVQADPSFDPMFLPERPGVPFQFKHKEFMMQSVQTQLKVHPLNAEIDDPAYVCRDLKTQTSIMCLPNEAVETFVPKLKKYRDHTGIQIKSHFKTELEDYTIDIIKNIIDEAIKKSQNNYNSIKEFQDLSTKIPGILEVDNEDTASISIKEHPLIKEKKVIELPTLTRTNKETPEAIDSSPNSIKEDFHFPNFPKKSSKVSSQKIVSSPNYKKENLQAKDKNIRFENIPEETNNPIFTKQSIESSTKSTDSSTNETKKDLLKRIEENIKIDFPSFPKKESKDSLKNDVSSINGKHPPEENKINFFYDSNIDYSNDVSTSEKKKSIEDVLRTVQTVPLTNDLDTSENKEKSTEKGSNTIVEAMNIENSFVKLGKRQIRDSTTSTDSQKKGYFKRRKSSSEDPLILQEKLALQKEWELLKEDKEFYKNLEKSDSNTISNDEPVHLNEETKNSEDSIRKLKESINSYIEILPLNIKENPSIISINEMQQISTKLRPNSSNTTKDISDLQKDLENTSSCSHCRKINLNSYVSSAELEKQLERLNPNNKKKEDSIKKELSIEGLPRKHKDESLKYSNFCGVECMEHPMMGSFELKGTQSSVPEIDNTSNTEQTSTSTSKSSKTENKIVVKFENDDNSIPKDGRQRSCCNPCVCTNCTCPSCTGNPQGDQEPKEENRILIICKTESKPHGDQLDYSKKIKCLKNCGCSSCQGYFPFPESQINSTEKNICINNCSCNYCQTKKPEDVKCKEICSCDYCQNDVKSLIIKFEDKQHQTEEYPKIKDPENLEQNKKKEKDIYESCICKVCPYNCENISIGKLRDGDSATIELLTGKSPMKRDSICTQTEHSEGFPILTKLEERPKPPKLAKETQTPDGTSPLTLSDNISCWSQRSPSIKKFSVTQTSNKLPKRICAALKSIDANHICRSNYPKQQTDEVGFSVSDKPDSNDNNFNQSSSTRSENSPKENKERKSTREWRASMVANSTFDKRSKNCSVPCYCNECICCENDDSSSRKSFRSYRSNKTVTFDGGSLCDSNTCTCTTCICNKDNEVVDTLQSLDPPKEQTSPPAKKENPDNTKLTSYEGHVNDIKEPTKEVEQKDDEIENNDEVIEKVSNDLLEETDKQSETIDHDPKDNNLNNLQELESKEEHVSKIKLLLDDKKPEDILKFKDEEITELKETLELDKEQAEKLEEKEKIEEEMSSHTNLTIKKGSRINCATPCYCVNCICDSAKDGITCSTLNENDSSSYKYNKMCINCTCIDCICDEANNSNMDGPKCKKSSGQQGNDGNKLPKDKKSDTPPPKEEDKSPKNYEGKQKNKEPIFDSPKIENPRLNQGYKAYIHSKSTSEVKQQTRKEAVKTCSMGCEPSKIPLELPTNEIQITKPSGDQMSSKINLPTYILEDLCVTPDQKSVVISQKTPSIGGLGDQLGVSLCPTDCVCQILEVPVPPVNIFQEPCKDHKSLQSLYHRDQPFKKLNKTSFIGANKEIICNNCIELGAIVRTQDTTQNLQDIHSNKSGDEKKIQVSEPGQSHQDTNSSGKNVTIISGDNNLNGFGIDIETLQPKITDQGIQIPLIIKFNGTPCFHGTKPPKYGDSDDKTFVTIDAKFVQERNFNEREVQTLLALGEKIKSESLNSFPEDFECSEFTETARSDGTSKQMTTWFSSPRTTSDIEDPFLTARPSSQEPGDKYFSMECTENSADTISPLQPISSAPDKICSALSAEIPLTRPNSEPCSYCSNQSKGRYTHVVEDNSQEKVFFFLDNLPSVELSKEVGLKLAPSNLEVKISASTQVKKCDCSHKIAESGDLTICNCRSCNWNEHISKIATTRDSTQHCTTGTQLTSCFCEKDLRSQCSLPSCKSNPRKCVSSTTFTIAEHSSKCASTFVNFQKTPPNKCHAESKHEYSTDNNKYYGKIISESHESYGNQSNGENRNPHKDHSPYLSSPQNPDSCTNSYVYDYCSLNQSHYTGRNTEAYQNLRSIPDYEGSFKPISQGTENSINFSREIESPKSHPVRESREKLSSQSQCFPAYRHECFMDSKISPKWSPRNIEDKYIPQETCYGDSNYTSQGERLPNWNESCYLQNTSFAERCRFLGAISPKENIAECFGINHNKSVEDLSNVMDKYSHKGCQSPSSQDRLTFSETEKFSLGLPSSYKDDDKFELSNISYKTSFSSPYENNSRNCNVSNNTSCKTGCSSAIHSRRAESTTIIGKTESNIFPKKTASCNLSYVESPKCRSIYVEPYFERKDPVIAAMIACEAELRPLKESLCQVKSQLRNLNMPELNCLFDNSPLVSPKKKSTSNIASFKFLNKPYPIRSIIKIQNPFGENTQFVEQQQFSGLKSKSMMSKELSNADMFTKEDYFSISPRKKHRLPFKHSFTIPFSSNNKRNEHRLSSRKLPENSDNYYNYLRYGISVQQTNDDLDTTSSKSPPCSSYSGRRKSGSQASYYDDDVIFKSTTRFNLSGDFRKCKNRSPRSLNSNMTFCTESCRSNEDFSSDWTTITESKSFDHCSCQHCQNLKSMHTQSKSPSCASQCPFLEAMKSLGKKKKNSKNISTFELDYPGLEDVCLKVEMKKPKKCKKLVKY